MENSGFVSRNQTVELETLFRSVESKFTLRMIRTSNRKNLQKFYHDISFLEKTLTLSRLEVEDLVDKRLLKFISRKEGRLTLTLKAILMLNYGIVNPSKELDTLLNSFDNEFFEAIMDTVESLDSDEKAVIIALLGLGALSSEYSLKVDEKNEEHFKNAVDMAAEFLKGLGQGFDDGKLERIWKRNVVGEGPVLGLMRRTNKIPIRTENVYVKQRKGHFVDILVNDEVDESRLKYLLDRLFDKRPLTYGEKKNLIKALNNIQQFELRIFKDVPPFDSLEVRKQVKRLIESSA